MYQQQFRRADLPVVRGNTTYTPGWNPMAEQGTAGPIRTATGAAVRQRSFQQPAPTMPSYLQAELDASARAYADYSGGRRKRSSKPTPTFSLSIAPHPDRQLTGAYFPGHHEESRRLAGIQAEQAFASQLGAMGYNIHQVRKILAANGFSGNGYGYVGGGTVAAGGGGGGGGVGGLADEFQGAMNSANARNEQRYGAVLQGMWDRYQRGLALLQGMGAQEAKDIQQAYGQRAAGIEQDVMNRGMNNTTVRQTMLQGNTREQNADLARLNERLRQQQLAVDAALSGDVLAAIERRTDKAPDYNQLAALAKGIGQAGGGAAAAPVFASPGEMGYMNPLAMMMMLRGGFAAPMPGGGGRRFHVLGRGGIPHGMKGKLTPEMRDRLTLPPSVYKDLYGV